MIYNPATLNRGTGPHATGHASAAFQQPEHPPIINYKLYIIN